MKRKLVSSVLTAGTLTVGSWFLSAPARALLIDFSGSGGPNVARSMSFGDPDGIFVTATGESQGLFNPNSSLRRNVFQNGNGLGVTFNTSSAEDNRVDGLGLDETLNLSFLQPVNLIAATFKSVDRSDEFRLLVNGEQFVDADIPGRRFNNTFTFTPSPVGTVFGFSVTDWDDDYLLKAIEVTPVPTPAAVLPALIGMGAAAFRRKKSSTNAADSEA